MWSEQDSTGPEKSNENQVFCARFKHMTLEVEERQRSNMDAHKSIAKQDNILISRKKSTAVTIQPLDVKIEPQPNQAETITKRPLHEHENPATKNLKIVCGGFMRGKSETCEDAFFASERSFGVADGVSGWNDFGFSSQEFATQLMMFSKQEAEYFDAEPGEKK